MDTNLQNKLGLGLAQVQTANMNAQAYNVANANQPGRFQIEGGIAGGSQGVIGQQKLSPPTPYESNVPSVAPLSESIPLNGFSTPASVSTPQGEIGKIGSVAGISKKKNTNIAEITPQVTQQQTLTPPVAQNLMGFGEATKGKDVQFRQSYRQAMIPPTPLDPSGLSGAELQAYKMLNPQEQAQYKALATQGMKAQTDYLAKSKANMEYQKTQEEQRLAMEDNTDAISNILSQKNIEESQKQVANLKQNLGYIGTGGQPGVSSQKLDAISNQVTTADRTLKNIIEVERLQKQNREIGQEKNAEIFTRQIKILQDDLDSKVNKTVQGALNRFNSAELEGKLDTIPEIEAFQQQLYAQLDGDLSSIMDTNIEARKFLIERYDKLAESQKEQMQAKEKAAAEHTKNANTLNKDMSDALGYYVDNNGNALVDKKTGQNIVVPPESTTNYDSSTGQMIIMTKNRDGSIGVQVKQVGAGKPDDVSYGKIGADENGNDIMGFINKTNQSVTQYGGAMGNGSQIPSQTVAPQAIKSISKRLQGNNVQCGMVTNDYSSRYFPDAPRMGDSYESKMNTINSIGVSNNPQVGGIFVMNTGTSTGHTGIVQSVNGDGTFTATDANAQSSPNGGPVKTSTYNIGPGTTFSIAPQTSTQFDLNKDSTYRAYLESGKLPAGMKTGTPKANNFEEQANAWKEANPGYISKEEKKDLAGIQNNIATDPRRKDYLSVASKEKILVGIQDRLAKGTATPQDKQQLVNDFAKILDPTSVVREGEYALAGKYAQSKINTMKQEIMNFFTTGGPLSDDAAKMLAEGVARRHIAIKQANDEAIDEGLANAKYLMGRDIPPEGVGAKYSDINPKAKLQATQKKLGTSGGLQDLISGISNLLNSK